MTRKEIQDWRIIVVKLIRMGPRVFVRVVSFPVDLVLEQWLASKFTDPGIDDTFNLVFLLAEVTIGGRRRSGIDIALDLDISNRLCQDKLGTR